MATPNEVTVWIGLDVGNEEHFADVLDDHGDRLFAESIGNDEADLVGLLDRAFHLAESAVRGPRARSHPAPATHWRPCGERAGLVEDVVVPLVRDWLRAGVVDETGFAPTEEGTPQGGVISPLFFNIAMHGMEDAARGRVPLGPPPGVDDAGHGHTGAGALRG